MFGLQDVRTALQHIGWHCGGQIREKLLLLERRAGREIIGPVESSFFVEAHEGVEASLRATLHIVRQCCLTETNGSAFLECVLKRTKAPLARAALRELLADEVDHARIGWGWLARAGNEVRRRVVQHLPSLIESHLAMWRPRSHHESTPTLVAHGYPPSDAIDEAVLGAVDDIILPGFAQMGMKRSGA